MQKPRRWRGLEFHLLSVVCSLACTSTPSGPATAPATASALPRTASIASLSAPIVAAPLPVTTQPSPAEATSAPPAPLPEGTRVLHIGDSFADALGGELGKLLKAAGLRNALEFKTPSYIPNWSYNGDIPKFLALYRPDLVLITLGANEIEIPHPEERIKPVQHLVGLLGGRPCVWIAPPLRKPDSGVIAVIRENVAPCRFLDSSALVPDLPRAPDKIHPSKEGRKIWAKAVFDWLARERAPSEAHPWALKPAASE